MAIRRREKEGQTRPEEESEMIGKLDNVCPTYHSPHRR